MTASQLTGAAYHAVWGTVQDYWTAILNPQFSHPYFIFLLPVLLYMAALWGRRQVAFVHPTLAPHKGLISWSTLVAASYVSLAVSVLHLDVAMMGPRLTEAKVEHLQTTRDVCVLNDSSGSMKAVLNDGVKELAEDNQKSAGDPGAITVTNGGSDKMMVKGKTAQEPPHPLTRVEAAQLAARYLIRHRMNDDPDNTDRFCLIRFDDDAYMMAPLTNDKLVALLRTAHITENVGGGTNFVVALQRLYDYLTQNSAPNATRVAIINTDGLDSIDTAKRQEFIAMYKQARIKLYVIGLGDSWKAGNTLDLQKFADELHKEDPTSGIVYRASNPGDMQKAMADIDRLEKSQEIVESTSIYRDADYAFIAGAIAFALIFFGLASLAGRVP